MEEAGNVPVSNVLEPTQSSDVEERSLQQLEQWLATMRLNVEQFRLELWAIALYMAQFTAVKAPSSSSMSSSATATRSFYCLAFQGGLILEASHLLDVRGDL